MRLRPTLGLAALIVLAVIVALLFAPIDGIPGRQRISALSDVLGILGFFVPSILGSLTVVLGRPLKRRWRLAIGWCSLSAALAGFGYLILRPPVGSAPYLAFLGGGLLVGGWIVSWRFVELTRRTNAIVSDASGPVPPDRQLIKYGAAQAADRLLHARLESVRQLCAPDDTSRSVALIAIPDRDQLVFRVHAVSSHSFEYITSVVGLELPFFKIREVAETYNKHVDAALSPEGKLMGRPERLQRYRTDVIGTASVCGYTALRNKPYIFHNVFENCLACRLEFLTQLPEESRSRFQFNDMVGLPVVTHSGLVGVVLVASLVGYRLTFNKRRLSPVIRSIGDVIERAAAMPGLEAHPLSGAVANAVPARTSEAFARFAAYLQPSFKISVPGNVIADALFEHKNHLQDWCVSRRQTGSLANSNGVTP